MAMHLCTWLKEFALTLSAGKSYATLLTTWNKEIPSKLDIYALGVTFDSMMHFSEHAQLFFVKNAPENNDHYDI